MDVAVCSVTFYIGIGAEKNFWTLMLFRDWAFSWVSANNFSSAHPVGAFQFYYLPGDAQIVVKCGQAAETEGDLY
jgi:hypothetical protein